MDVLAQLKDEDDNPRGQGGGKFLGGATNLEEAAANEARRQEIRAQRWPIGRQEAGILDLMQAKNMFARLRLPEPRMMDGGPHWDVRREQIDRAFEAIRKCCDPEWSSHPKRERGWTLLREAVDTLTNANGKRDEYVRQVAEQARERELALAAAAAAVGSGGGNGTVNTSTMPSARAAAAAAAAEAAADMEQQMAAKRKRLLQEKLRRSQVDPGGPSGAASRGFGSPRAVCRGGTAAADGDEHDEEEEEEEEATVGPRRPANLPPAKQKPKKRPKFM
jgi:hypothetical protein